MSDFNIQAISECSKNDKEIYGFARMSNLFDYMKNLTFLTIYGAQTKIDLARIMCTRDDFAFNFLKVFKNSKLKGFIFQIDGIAENVDFIRCMRLNVALLNIPYIFFTTSEHMRTAILVAADIPVKVGERIVEVLIDNDGYVVSELEYTEHGYLEREQRDCKPYKKMTAEAIRKRILGSNNLVKIICHANHRGNDCTKYLTQNVLNTIPASKWMVMEVDLSEFDGRFVEETVKWMRDKSYTKFYVCQESFRNYMVSFKYGGKHHPLLVCKKHEVLPFNKTITIPRSFLEYFHAHTDHNDIDILESRALEAPKEVHALKFSLNVDESNFTSADVRGLIYNKISRLPAQLDSKKLGIPVIGFCGELSFIYVKDADGSGYKLLDSWNGKLGRDLYISFAEEKPQFFEKAVKKFLCFGNSVIHDIIKVMSIAPDQLSSHQSFGYSITSDADHPVLMVVENYSGEKKAASPSFLMALFLKQHLKELKSKLGRMPNEIGFCIFDDFDNDADAKKRVENGLKESCQMLNGLECRFIGVV